MLKRLFEILLKIILKLIIIILKVEILKLSFLK